MVLGVDDVCMVCAWWMEGKLEERWAGGFWCTDGWMDGWVSWRIGWCLGKLNEEV